MYARIIDNVAVDVAADPTVAFHPELAAEFVEVPGEVEPGWRLVDDVWRAPEPVAEPGPEPVYRLQLTPVEFKMLFSPGERLAIRKAREYAGDDEGQRDTAWLIDDWWQIVDDPRLTEVNLSVPQTQDGLAMLVAAGILTPERHAEIRKGVPE